MVKINMNGVLSLPGRGSTSFFFTQMGEEGFSRGQQSYIYELIRTYRMRFPELEITGVWDFGMEEGTRYESRQRGVFRDCRDNAVFNSATLSIAYNHIRVSKMPSDLSPGELDRILQEYEVTAALSRMAARMWEELRSAGVPPVQIRERVREEAAQVWKRHFPEAAGMEKGPHNALSLEDPLFADVRAIRQLEESMNIRRLTVHELGHALADLYGVLKDRRIRKLFAACRDGFEDRDEFCAECFMVSELTDAIPLANRVAAVYRERAGVQEK